MIFTLGYIRWNWGRMLGSRIWARVALRPRWISPIWPSSISWIFRVRFFSRLEIRSRVFRRAMPDSVMVSRGVRSNSRVPSSVSKCLICSLRHCWVTWARLAARVKFIFSTASRNIFCEVSMASSFRVQERFASFILSQDISCEYMEEVLFYIVNKVCYFYYKSQRIMKNITGEKR